MDLLIKIRYLRENEINFDVLIVVTIMSLNLVDVLCISLLFLSSKSEKCFIYFEYRIRILTRDFPKMWNRSADHLGTTAAFMGTLGQFTSCALNGHKTVQLWVTGSVLAGINL